MFRCAVFSFSEGAAKGSNLQKGGKRYSEKQNKRRKTKEEKKTTQDFSDMVLQAVVDEDYKMGLQIQTNISKLESIYYNSILNYNGLNVSSTMKISDIELDNKIKSNDRILQLVLY